MRSVERQKGYDEGYKQALLDVASSHSRKELEQYQRGIEIGQRMHERNTILGGPNSRFKPRGIPGSIYNDD